MNLIPFRIHSVRKIHNSTSLFFPKRWKEKTEVPFQSELKNPVAEVYGAAEAWPDDEVRRPSFRSDI